MQEVEMTWQSPVEVVQPDGQPYWQKECEIPGDLEAGFFAYWNAHATKLKSRGYSLLKKAESWSIIQITPKLDLTCPPVPVKYPEGLRPWQVESVGKLCGVIKNIQCAIDGSDMGVGKTYAAIGVARELNVPFVVVCPKAVKGQWFKVITEHFKLKDKLIDVVNYESLTRGRKDSKVCELVQNKIMWKLPPDSLIIYDEAHKLKNYGTKNSKFCLDARRKKYKMLFLSATMATNPTQLRTVGYCLGLFKTASEYYTWLEDHGCKKDYWGWKFNNDRKTLLKLNDTLFKMNGIRLKRDMIPNFPETEIIVDAYDLDAEKTAKINATCAQTKAELERLKKLKDDSASELVVRLRNRQIIELLKTDIFVELVEDGLEAGMSIIIFVNYCETIDALSKLLKTDCVFDGRLPENVRQENLARFQRNEERVILVNIKAGNVGLNMPDLDGQHPRLTLISPDDNSNVIKQCLGRAVRENSKSKTLQKIVLVNNTVETQVMANLGQKLDNMELINDGDLRII
jgi:superfamily II DNA or RNA helicase